MVSGWLIEPHVCRCCGGRVVSQERDDEATLYRCTNCGAEAAGRKPSAICGCGIKLRGTVDAGLRCRPNPSRTPESPGEIVVVQAEVSTGSVR